MLNIPEYAALYKQYLRELVADDGIMSRDASMARIRQWQKSIEGMVPNDTGEDMEIRDEPASWSSNRNYRLLETGSNNYFEVKAASIRKYCGQ